MDWKRLLIRDDLTIKDMLKLMDEGGEKILFRVDERGILKGAITDGDIRRYFLSHGNLNATISNIYNPDPLYLRDDHDRDEAKIVMMKNKIEVMPIVDGDKRVVGALSWTDLLEKGDMPISGAISVPVVIMAGGKGERLDPFTKILPKPLIPIGEKPIIEIIMDEFSRYGVGHFYVTLNYKGEMVKIYFENSDKEYEVDYIREDNFLGTAGSLNLLPPDIEETFIVSNCDIIVKVDYADLLRFHKENNNILTVVGSIQHYRIPYGVIDFEEKGKLKKIEEKPEYDLTVNTGVYVLSKKAISLVPENEYFDMTLLIEALIEKGENVGVYPVSEKSYTDVGQWEEYKKHFEKMVI